VPSSSAAMPVALFQAPLRQPVVSADLFGYDVRRDGQGFLINTQMKQQRTEPMTMVLNRAEKLNK